MGDFKKKIEDYLISKSKKVDWDNIEEYSSTAIALALNMKRSTVSQLLNEGAEENKFIKVNSKPITYFHLKTIENIYSVSLLKYKFESIEEFRIIINDKKQDFDFSMLIGYNGSLKHCIDQCKSAITYPGNGLPVLLCGEPGTGKSQIAKIMGDYARNKGFIPAGGRFLTVNCAEYSNNPELLLTNLFGYKKGAFTGAEKEQEGLIALADNGVLFMDEVHGLKPECQEKLFLFMDKGIYHMVGDNKTWYKSNVRFFFATTENPNEVLLKTLLRRIPITVKIPSLEERPIKDKKDLIRYILSLEESKINKKIRISRLVYQMLLTYKYIGNIGQMINIIKASVANSLVNSEKYDSLNIHMYNLPVEVIEGCVSITLNPKEDQKMIDIWNLNITNSGDNKLFLLNQYLIEGLEEWEQKLLSFDDIMDKTCEKIQQYIDFLYFDENKIDKFTETTTVNILNNVINLINHKYSPISFSNNEIGILARVLLDYANFIDSSEDFTRQYKKLIDSFLEQLCETYNFQSKIVDDLSQLLVNYKLLPKNSLSRMNLFLLLCYLKRNFIPTTIPGIIIAHGYSIASGIAEVANQLIGQHVYDSIDMPIDCDIFSVSKKLIEHLKRIKKCSEIIVLVDMGSLESIHSHLEHKFDMNIGIINNVTTRMALDVASMITQKKNMEYILEKACLNNTNSFSLVKNKRKKDVILSVCQTGIGSANKIANLIIQSFPRKIDIIIIPYDFINLHTMGVKSSLFEKYNVLFIVGTIDPQVENVPFISIEELIEFHNPSTIYSIFDHKFRMEEVEQFNQNIVRNFSLENLIGYLNILDPSKIIKNVEDVINELQREFNFKFNSGTILGLYIHISCLIERIIIGKDIIDYSNLEDFKKSHNDFIKIVNKIFLEIEITYNVKIPESEIAYLYDYIYLEKCPCVSTFQSTLDDLFDFHVNI